MRCSAALDWTASPFDAELLVLARRLGLAVTEVPVRAEERDGSKVQLAVDAVAILADVPRVRRWAVSGSYDGAVSQVPDLSPAAALGAELGPATQAG